MPSLHEPLVFRDVAVGGDVTQEPVWRELMGLDTAKPTPVSAHLKGRHNQESHGNDGVGGALDKLKLAGRTPAGFSVRSSRKVKTDTADIGIAEVDGPDGPQVRVGIITAESGKWDAGFSGEDRKAQLREQIAQKQDLFESAEGERADALEEEIAELESELEALDAERTAILTLEVMADFRRQLGDASVLAKENKTKQDAIQKAFNALEEQIDELADEHSDPELERKIRKAQGHLGSLRYRLRLVREDPKYAHYIPEAEADVAEAERDLDPLLARRAALMPPEARARLEDLERQKAALTDLNIDDIITSAEVAAPSGGRVRAEIWGSDDIETDWVNSRLYVLAAGESRDDANDQDDYADFRGLRGLNKLIAAFGAEEVTAAAGADVTPGNDELHHYWTKGEGLAKWSTSAHPWTALVRHLTKHVGRRKAEVFASKWFHEVFGMWSGERKGKNPTGPG